MSLVLSEVYGGGGNSGAPYANDFVEIFNRSASPVSVAGWSVQYASATGTSWSATALPSATLQPGQHLLVQEASGGVNGVALPAPDATGTIAMASTAGKVVLASTTTSLTGACPSDPSIVDLVGYGSTAGCFEGAPAPAPSNTNSDQRGSSGCADTDQNADDFAAAAPDPQNTQAAASPCGTTAVGVASLAATRDGRAVVLRWRTGAEVGVVGFDVYRGAARLNRTLIAAVGGSGGHAYSLRDAHPRSRARYRLQEVRADGSRAWTAFPQR